jgi:hypothetical protein
MAVPLQPHMFCARCRATAVDSRSQLGNDTRNNQPHCAFCTCEHHANLSPRNKRATSLHGTNCTPPNDNNFISLAL